MIKITHSVNWNEIQDCNNEWLDVYVELDDGYTYNINVTTTQNLEDTMNGIFPGSSIGTQKTNYFTPGPPFIIVKRLTKAIKKLLKKQLLYTTITKELTTHQPRKNIPIET